MPDTPYIPPADSRQDTAPHLQSLLQEQRDAHQTDPMPSLDVRRDRLDRLYRLLEQNTDSFIRAISEDFGNRSAHETRLAEIMVMLAEIRHTQKRLAGWMRPRRIGTTWPFWPARNRLVRQPLGVVGVISPWNYPLQLALSPALGALAAGNRVMLKPSEFTPRFSQALQQAVTRYFATSEMAVVTGDAEVGKAFSQLPFDHLLFTGSTAVGRLVAQAAAPNLTPVTLELGGKSPALIDLSADLAVTAMRIATGKLLNAGQTCVAPDYVLVHRSQFDAFTDAYGQAVRTLYPQIPDNPDYTSIIHQKHFGRLVNLMEEAHAQGAEVVALGETQASTRRLAPCMVLNPPADCKLMQEEIFGPILPVLPYDHIDQALQRINQGPHPLALYWFGNDANVQEKVLTTTLSGGVTINDCVYHVAQVNQPFGGVGASGMGAYHGEWGFRTFSKEKPVFIQSPLAGSRMLRPPYGKQFEQLMGLLMKWG
ncbi:MAG: coniferyl aldehyde dehydrogenase [Brachymonas sp.]|nr:coniferyl aldehyde dehydrogenase [Brachymonas sp.]